MVNNVRVGVRADDVAHGLLARPVEHRERERTCGEEDERVEEGEHLANAIGG